MHLNKTLITLILAAAALLTGCASAPTPEVMKSETATFTLPKSPEKGKAIAYVVRPSTMGKLIRFNVFLDDQEAASEMGYTRGYQYIYFNLTPGAHKVYSKAENWSEVSVDAKAGDVIFIQQDASMGLVMVRNSIAQVADYQGKYHVMNLDLGTILKSDK